MTHSMTAAHAPAAQAAGRRLLITALLLAGRALEQLAARLATAPATEALRPGLREFHLVEQEGRMVGMLYEDGHLVALMPEVGRL